MFLHSRDILKKFCLIDVWKFSMYFSVSPNDFPHVFQQKYVNKWSKKHRPFKDFRKLGTFHKARKLSKQISVKISEIRKEMR